MYYYCAQFFKALGKKNVSSFLKTSMENYLIILLWVWFQCLLSPHEMPVILEPAGCGEAIPFLDVGCQTWLFVEYLGCWHVLNMEQVKLLCDGITVTQKKKKKDKKIKGSQLFTELYWVPHFLFRLTNMIWCGNDLNHTKCMFRGKRQKWQKENKQLDSALSDVTSLHWQQWLLFLLIWGQHSWTSSQQCKQER